MKQQFLSFLALIICVITPLFGQGKKNTSVPSHEFFIENKGQWPEEVKYLSRIKGMDAWVTNDGITYDLYSLKNKASSQVSAVKKIEYKRSGHVISMSFKNALSGVMTEAREEQPGYYNYFIGSDPAKWTSHVRLFKEVSLLKVYEGIDTRIYHDEGSLRYDMIVKAGADPNQIAMTFEGAHGVSINTKGELVVKTALGDVIQQKLFAFQEVAGKRKKVECSFAFNNGEVGFALGKYDKTKPLIIDPLIYSTYLGSSNTDQLTAIAVDTAGAIYVTGTTASQNYPIQPNELGVYDYIWEKGEVVVTKLSRDGRSLIYSTFVGGSAGEMGYGIAVDQTLNVYVCGITFGREVNPVRNWFPTTTGAYDQTFNDDPNLIAPVGDAFVFKINSSGSSLLYSTFI
ncbi:MAG TPA: SBBP repeat-containing protein, partial [Patescibacteria group bacterium]|nr:SBBP repeat-containing protein [Patescibacteria group bacterium]